ncbi:MAG: hypothetical protein ABDI19_02900 [Armatimonadota bacterium]
MRRLGFWLVLSVLLTGCGGGGGGTEVRDSNAPLLSQIELQHMGNSVMLSVVAQDAETGIASVIAIATVGPSTQTFQMSAADGQRYQVGLPSNTVRVNVRATDRAGNSRESGSIPVPPPQPPFP